MSQIQIDDQVMHTLEQMAKLRGMTLQEFLTSLARDNHDLRSLRLPTDQIMKMIEDESIATGSAYKGTFSREDIYVDHP